MDFEFSEEDEHSGNMNAELNDMLDLIGRKCSICFIVDSETEISSCGDQFCYNCLERYWIGRMEESLWGIRPVPLDCPVCRIIIKEEDNKTWLQWASPELKQLYLKMSFKRPIITRTCQECGHDQSIIGEAIEDSLEELFEGLTEEIPITFHNQIFRRIELGDLVGLFRYLGRHFASQKPSVKLVYFLRQLLQTSQKDGEGGGGADVFANRQLVILSICSGTVCDFCLAKICIRCGQNDWHEGLSCLEFLKECLSKLNNPNDPEHLSLTWKVTHGKPCPKCFLLVTKDDDDGSCNQMKCSHCGYNYCWECLREWSNACGYYRCSIVQTTTDNNNNNNNTSSSGGDSRKNSKHHRNLEVERTEAGIPNVTKLPSFTSPPR